MQCSTGGYNHFLTENHAITGRYNHAIIGGYNHAMQYRRIQPHTYMRICNYRRI